MQEAPGVAATESADDETLPALSASTRVSPIAASIRVASRLPMFRSSACLMWSTNVSSCT